MIEVSETRCPVRIAFYLAFLSDERNDSAHSDLYILPDIFRYSITATGDIARRSQPQKHIINRMLARSPVAIYARVEVPIHAYKSVRTRAQCPHHRYSLVCTSIGYTPSLAEGRSWNAERALDRQESYPNTRPESSIQIESNRFR